MKMILIRRSCPSYIKSQLCSCGTNLENYFRNISFGKFLTQTWFYIFRVAISMVICNIWNQMGTLIRKVISDSSYLCLKTLKSIICFSGFPRKACQGCHISEGARTILIKIIFSKYRNVCHSCHASAISGNSMCCIQVGCVSFIFPPRRSLRLINDVFLSLLVLCCCSLITQWHNCCWADWTAQAGSNRKAGRGKSMKPKLLLLYSIHTTNRQNAEVF